MLKHELLFALTASLSLCEFEFDGSPDIGVYVRNSTQATISVTHLDSISTGKRQ